LAVSAGVAGILGFQGIPEAVLSFSYRQTHRENLRDPEKSASRNNQDYPV
jgi:hypothetical protein